MNRKTRLYNLIVEDSQIGGNLPEGLDDLDQWSLEKLIEHCEANGLIQTKNEGQS